MRLRRDVVAAVAAAAGLAAVACVEFSSELGGRHFFVRTVRPAGNLKIVINKGGMRKMSLSVKVV
jgi:hypothetical protein